MADRARKSPAANGSTVAEWCGGIDVYLFDQLQKNRFKPGMRVLDAGCGTGRNLVYMLRTGFDVYAIDRDVTAIAGVQRLASEIVPGVSPHRFQVADIASLPFHDEVFDIVLCNAVLHFAEDEKQFTSLCHEMMRVLASGGFFFSRLASDIGIEDRVVAHGSRRFTLPDGSERFLVNEAMLLAYTKQLGGRLFEPIKTVNVQGQRCMTTWCVRKD